MASKDEEAYVLQLEDALYQAYNSIEFLHGCLTEPGLYRYDYPQMTQRGLARIHELLPPRPSLCVHSVRKPGECVSCDWQIARAQRRFELGITPSLGG